MTTLNDVTAIGDVVHFFQWAKTRRDLGKISIRTVDGQAVSGAIVHATKDFIILGDTAKPGAPIKADVVMLAAISSVALDAAPKT